MTQTHSVYIAIRASGYTGVWILKLHNELSTFLSHSETFAVHNEAFVDEYVEVSLLRDNHFMHLAAFLCVSKIAFLCVDKESKSFYGYPNYPDLEAKKLMLEPWLCHCV